VNAAACEFIIFMTFLFCFVLVFWFWVWFLEAGGALTIDLGKLHSILFTRNKKLDELFELRTGS
jgi:hypothetical protein